MAVIDIIDHSSYHIDTAPISHAVSHYLHLIAEAWGERVWYCADRLTASGFQLGIVDTLNVQGALGYHDLGQDGRPYALIGAKVCIDNNVSVSSVVTHEIAEMVGDPLANEWVSDGKGTLWARELCDATEGDTFKVYDVEVANFLFPAYFNPFSTGPFDYMGVVTAPFSIRSTGYAIYEQEGQVQQKFGEAMPDWKKALKLSRRADERATKRGVGTTAA